MYNSKKVSISIGGGLGDAIQTYLANPESHCKDGENNFPTTNHMASVWFRRLEDFKTKNPDAEVALITTSHNLVTKELFGTNPFIDVIYSYEWVTGSVYRLWGTLGIDYTGQESSIDVEMEYNPIYWMYDYQDFEVSDGIDFHLTKDETEELKSFLHPYIVFHQEALRPRDIMPKDKYIELHNILRQKGYNAHYIDKDCGLNPRMSTLLTLNCDGFAGVHSAMWLPAVWAGWKYGIKTVCFIPIIPHFERIKDSAVAWGFKQSFNKTFKYNNYYEASQQNMQEVADWIIDVT